MKKQIKNIVIFLLLIALALPVDEGTVKASDNVNPDSTGESISPTPPSGILVPAPTSSTLPLVAPIYTSTPAIYNARMQRKGAAIEFTWTILNFGVYTAFVYPERSGQGI